MSAAATAKPSSGMTVAQNGTGAHHPAAMRNRPHIYEALSARIPADAVGAALEISSGTGCHLEAFAPAFPGLTWHPTEYDDNADDVASTASAAASSSASSSSSSAASAAASSSSSSSPILSAIDRHCADVFDNCATAAALDASAPWDAWPATVREQEGQFAVVYLANVLHITPWAVTVGVLRGAGRALRRPDGDGPKRYPTTGGGQLFVYGPFKVDGKCTTPSNAQFDEMLRARDASFGYRDIDEVAIEGEKYGLELTERIPMPANNFMLCFRRRGEGEEKGEDGGGGGGEGRKRYKLITGRWGRDTGECTFLAGHDCGGTCYKCAPGGGGEGGLSFSPAEDDAKAEPGGGSSLT